MQIRDELSDGTASTGLLACRRQPIRARGSAALISLMVVAGVSLAACGGPSPGVVTGSTTTSAAMNSTHHANSGTAALLAYSSCVRSHGVPTFPDPSNSGGIPKVTAQQLGVGQSQLQAAEDDCKDLLPTGGSLSGQPNQTISVEQQRYYLEVAACMRSHRITDFPEPSFFGGSVEFQGLGHLAGVHSALFTNAFRVCRKIIPPELPYGSAPGG